jgi:tetratricopeptide (TPR) repeat protein
VKLLRGEREAITRRYTDNVELHNLYLLGRHHWNKFTPEGFTKSAECYELAIKKDPDYTLAYVGAAEVRLFTVFFVASRPRDEIPQAKAHVKHALMLDPNLAEAHAVAGRASLFYDWDRTAAEEAFTRAIELEPNSPFILSHYSDFLSLTDRHEDAIETIMRARELDPLNSFLSANAGERIFHAGRTDEAIEVLQQAISLAPDYYYAHFILGCAFKTVSQFDRAIAHYEIALESSGRMPMVAANLANCYWRAGQRSSANDLLKEVEEVVQRRYVPACFLFSMYNARGEHDQAYTWFERALEERDFMAPFCVNWPDDDLRFPDEARYTDRLQEVGLVQ